MGARFQPHAGSHRFVGATSSASYRPARSNTPEATTSSPHPGARTSSSTASKKERSTQEGEKMVLIAADKHLSARPNRNPNKNQNHPNERPVANTPAPLSARQSPVGTPQRLLRHPAG